MGARTPITISQWLGEMPDLQESQLPIGAAVSAVDCDLHPFLRPRLSPADFFTVPAGQIVRKVGYLDTAQRFLVLTEQKAYRADFNGLNVTDITPATGFTPSAWWQISQQKDALYFVNGIDFIGKFDGTSITYLTLNGAPKGARFIASYQGHLVVADVLDAANVRQRNQIRLSDIFNPTVWNAGVAVDVNLDTRSPITGLAVTQNTLVVFTENEIWNVPYVGGYPPVYVQKQWEGIGCIAPGSLSVTPDGQIFFLAEDGFYRYSVGSSPELISPYHSEWLRNNFDRANKDKVLSGIIPQRGVYVVVLPLIGGGQWVGAFNYRVGAWSRYNLSADSLQTLSLPEWTCILGQGNAVKKWIGTDAVNYSIVFPLSDWQMTGIVKRLDYLEVISNDGSGAQVTVTFRRSNIPTSAVTLPSRTVVNQPMKNRVYDSSAIGVYLGFSLQGSIGIERILLVLEDKGARVG